MKPRTNTTFWLAVIFTMGASQLTRWYFAKSITINMGLAFNIMLPTILVFVVVIVFLGLMLWLFYSQKKNGIGWAMALGMIVGGGASNFLDRILLSGGVADYWNLGNFSYINLADVAITLGIIIALGILIKNSWNQK